MADKPRHRHKRPGLSNESALTEFRDANGRIITADHFENEPGPMRPVESFMSIEDLEAFDAEGARIKAQVQPKK